MSVHSLLMCKDEEILMLSDHWQQTAQGVHNQEGQSTLIMHFCTYEPGFSDGLTKGVQVNVTPTEEK